MSLYSAGKVVVLWLEFHECGASLLSGGGEFR
jgi:hypothetical protein